THTRWNADGAGDNSTYVQPIPTAPPPVRSPGNYIPPPTTTIPPPAAVIPPVATVPPPVAVITPPPILNVPPTPAPGSSGGGGYSSGPSGSGVVVGTPSGLPPIPMPDTPGLPDVPETGTDATGKNLLIAGGVAVIALWFLFRRRSE